MNLLLIRAGYPPVAIRPEDRKAYLDALEHASMRVDTEPFGGDPFSRVREALKLLRRESGGQACPEIRRAGKDAMAAPLRRSQNPCADSLVGQRNSSKPHQLIRRIR